MQRCIILLFLTLSVSGHAYGRHFRDTLHFKKALAEKSGLVLTDSALNEIGIDSILNKIENVHNTLTRIINATSVGFDTREIQDELPEIDSNIDIIDDNLSLYQSVLDVKNLQMFRVLLAGLKDQLSDWRTEIFKDEKDLVEMGNEMGTFKKDTLLKEIINDSAFKSLYSNEIADLKGKWKLAKKSLSDNLTRINLLQSTVSNEYFTTIDLETKSRDLLKKISVQSLGKEYDYLWDIRSSTIGESKQANELAKKSYQGQQKILYYYFRRNWTDQLWMLLAGVILMLWIFRNFKKIEKLKVPENTVPVPSFYFISKLSLLPTVVVLFNIAPFFDLHPPTAYIEIIEFLLVISLTALLWKNWPRKLFFYWLSISALYIAFSVTGAFLTPNLGFRVFLFVLNLGSIAFGISWFLTLRKNTVAFSLMIKIVTVIYFILNFAAVFCNLFGRLSLAKIFSVTGIFGLTQIIGLTIFIQIVTEAFQLQTIVNKMKGGITSKLNFTKMEGLLNKALMIISVCIWFIVFTISLNMYNLLFFKLKMFLTTQRTVGSTSFQVGNILLFIAIIYVSNLLQQGVGSLYGKSNNNWDPEVKKNGSRLAMTRLVLIVIGFLIAIAASGIPMDKITIVLGALGVGIGLGLQTIVNNLVSGVILIFEQPFRIGDFIEVGDKKGRVLDIGIRSSKIIMDEGAELILPNADLLSGRVINWTMRNENMRIELPLSIEKGPTLEQIEKAIIEELEKSDQVVKETPPEILLTSQTDKAMNINVLIWINDVHKLAAIKSQLLNSLYSSLSQKGIKIM